MTWAIATGIAIGAVVGGGSAALQHKDILKGALLGGATGAVTGGIGSLAGSATGAVADAAASNIADAGIGAQQAAALPYEFGSGAAPAIGSPSVTNPLFADPTKYLSDNKMGIGLSALAGGMAPNASQPAGPDMGTIRPYTYTAGLNPGYTGAGTPYFNQHYTAGTPYAAAEGGIMHLAGGGSAVSDYNKMLMDRAQQEYVNSPPLGAFRSHFNDPIANAGAVAPAAPTGPVAFDPVSRRYIAIAAPAAAATTPNAPVQATGDNQVGGGAANGGLMGYAMGGGIGSYYPSPDDGQGGQHPQDTMMGAHPSVSMGPSYPMQGIKNEYADGGGIGNLGSYSDGGRLLKGPGDGVSDDIPAEIGGRQPARLADGEFVVPARIVSELGNGSTDAGAKQLYAMMNRVQANRRKTVGDGNVAVDSRSSKYLPA